MCIYLTSEKELHYISADHIIPAGIGGIKQLPLKYVSSEFNNKFSVYEQDFLRSSILALPRQVLGPGKRGSLNSSKATKSKVNVFRPISNERTYSLGYIQQGKPFEIPNILLNTETGEFTVGLPKESSEIDLQYFKKLLRKFDSLNLRMIKFSKMPQNLFLIGIKSEIEENFNCFIASRDGKTHPFNTNVLNDLSNLVGGRANFSDQQPYKIITHQTAIFKETFFQCNAKIAFNCLAHIKGKEFVLDEGFDPIRNYIINGGENNFVRIVSQGNEWNKEIFPQDSHRVLISKAGDKLIGEVSLYDFFKTSIILQENYEIPFQLNGIVCDWKQKREYDLYEYLTEFSKMNLTN